ncbi:stress-activated protein kinase signaling cascade [Ascochyta rabiei]|uniref:stress-activated protein kinase signaling cascade n=1 Tax=Didymella rabiei TaxID=5454 RepID=UPI00220085DB|nr:stress-activated protein kinase signaling cascade [Ascochyta rabiei]UPX14881.1 stress-activated protein kinase signaling cascade [Ascochyta rabiei]
MIFPNLIPLSILAGLEKDWAGIAFRKDCVTMTSMAKEKAFRRHSRPQASVLDKATSLNRLQVPTKVALLEKSIQKKKEVSTNPWKTLSVQGELIQGKSKWQLCIQEGLMAIVKSVEIEPGRRELEKIRKLSPHPHVATINQVFESDTSMFFKFEYSRFTLEEVLNVHLSLDESHVRIIASSVRFNFSGPADLLNFIDVPRSQAYSCFWHRS